VHRDPRRWEYADEVMDNLGEAPKSVPAFVKRLNRYLKDCDVKLRVPLIGELRADGVTGPDAYQRQAKDLSLALNRLFEAIHEEREKANLVVPREYFERRELERIESMRQAYEAEATKLYGSCAEAAPVGDYDPPTWDEGHEALLEAPDLLERLVAWGDAQVKDMPDLWRAIFLGIASLKAPPIRQGSRVHSPGTDVLMVGEFSTAKSDVLGLVKKLAPKCMVKSNFTPVRFTGTVDREGNLRPGIALEANGGVLCVDELDKLLRRYPVLDGLFRMAQSQHHIDHGTFNGDVDYDTTFLTVAGANPVGDRFSETVIADQVPFKEGFLSRYAYIKPLAYSMGKVDGIAGFMASTWFSDEEPSEVLDAGTIRSMFAALYARLMEVNRVAVSRELLAELHERFTEVQEDVAGLPLLSTRDMGSAMRYLNASAALYVAQRDVVDGMIIAMREDLENALFMLDATAQVRRTMLMSTRNAVAVTPLDRAHSILRNELERQGELGRKQAVEILMERLQLSQATAYRYLENLALRGDIEVNGLRDSTIGLAPS